MSGLLITIDVAGEPSVPAGTGRVFDFTKVSPTPPLVTLGLSSTAGITEYFWELIAQPHGASVVLSDPTVSNPTFTPTARLPGTYLIRCLVNQSTAFGTAGLAFRTQYKSLRIPAPIETVEFGTSTGWQTAMREIIESVDIGADGQVLPTIVDMSTSGAILTSDSGKLISANVNAGNVPFTVSLPAPAAGLHYWLTVTLDGTVPSGYATFNVGSDVYGRYTQDGRYTPWTSIRLVGSDDYLSGDWLHLVSAETSTGVWDWYAWEGHGHMINANVTSETWDWELVGDDYLTSISIPDLRTVPWYPVNLAASGTYNTINGYRLHNLSAAGDIRLTLGATQADATNAVVEQTHLTHKIQIAVPIGTTLVLPDGTQLAGTGVAAIETGAIGAQMELFYDSHVSPHMWTARLSGNWTDSVTGLPIPTGVVGLNAAYNANDNTVLIDNALGPIYLRSLATGTSGILALQSYEVTNTQPVFSVNNDTAGPSIKLIGGTQQILSEDADFYISQTGVGDFYIESDSILDFSSVGNLDIESTAGQTSISGATGVIIDGNSGRVQIGPNIAVGAAPLAYIRNYFTGSFTSDVTGVSSYGQYFDGTITSVTGNVSYQIGSRFTNTITTQNNSETIAGIAQVYIEEPNITKGTDTVTTAASLWISGAPTEGNSNYAVYVGGGQTTLLGNLSVGSTPLGYVKNYFGGNFTSNGASSVAYGQLFGGTITGANGDDTLAGTKCSNLITTQDNSETIFVVAQLYISEPSITKGTDTIEKACSIYVENAPTEGTDNYSIYVGNGKAFFGAAGIITNTIDGYFGGVSIAGTASSNFTVTGNSAGDQTLTISASNAGAGNGNMTVTAQDELTFTARLSSLYFNDVDNLALDGYDATSIIGAFNEIKEKVGEKVSATLTASTADNVLDEIGDVNEGADMYKSGIVIYDFKTQVNSVGLSNQVYAGTLRIRFHGSSSATIKFDEPWIDIKDPNVTFSVDISGNNLRLKADNALATDIKFYGLRRKYITSDEYAVA